VFDGLIADIRHKIDLACKTAASGVAAIAASTPPPSPGRSRNSAGLLAGR
jgi:hypothetical protein